MSTLFYKVDWSLIMSIVALFFSLITYLINDAKIKRQEKLINQYQIEKIEVEKINSKKALIKANVINGLKSDKVIKIFNAGKNLANNVRLEIISEDQDFTIINFDSLPYEFLHPQESIDLFLFTHTGSPDKVKIQLIWDDEFARDNKHLQILSI